MCFYLAHDFKYVATISSPEFVNRIEYVVQSVDEVDSLGGELSNLIIDAAVSSGVKKVGGKRRSGTSHSGKKHRGKNWFDAECSELRRKVRVLGRALRVHPYNLGLRDEFRAIRKRYSRVLSRKKREFRTGILAKMDTLRSSNPKDYWRLFNELSGRDKKQCSSDISALEWWNFFVDSLNEAGKVDAKSLGDARTFVESERDLIFNELNFRISEEEIRGVIRSLKAGKASGPDLVLNEMLRVGADYLMPALLKVFNSALSSGRFPQVWTSGIINPLFKKGDPTQPANYRAIIVGSNIGKLFCSVLNRRLLNFIFEHDLIPKEQIGFTKGCRTSDHILTLKVLIDKALKDVKGKLYCCFVDFKNAFPSVPRPLLFEQLLKAGIGGNFLSTIQDMYKKVNFQVRVGSGLTDSIESGVGLKQGCNLSPSLFNIYTRDMPGIFEGCDPISLDSCTLNCLMYADDTIK